MATAVLDSGLQHPVLQVLDEIDALREKCAEVPIWTLPPGELAHALERMEAAQRWLESVTLRTLREADRHQVGDAVGAANTAGWWSTVTRRTKREAHRAVALAARLDDDAHAVLSAGMARSAVSVGQAAVIVDAVDALPADLVDPELRRRAEIDLVALAEHHDPRELRILGRRILDVIAPEIGEAHEQAILEREEREALATASLRMSPDGHGSLIGRFKIPMLAGEMLQTHLAAIAAPRHQAASGPLRERVARPLRLGRAFVEYIETRAKTGMPKAGGVAATVVVTTTLDSLLTGDGAATLGSGERISASEARRLICEADAYSAFLSTPSQVLDLGRRARFHTEPQRIAIAQRDRGCVADGCDWPPGMCHVHHPRAWSDGGGTSYENGMLLCPRHHTLAHDRRYQLKAGKGGRVAFSRRR